DQPRGRAFELERFRASLAGIKLFGLRLGADHDPRMAIIERVDQKNEALGLVALRLGQDRYMVDEDRVEASDYREEVARAVRLFAKIGKTEARHVAYRARYMHCAALYRQVHRRLGI